MSNYFEVRRYLNGQATTGTSTGSNLQCRVQFTVSIQVKKLVLRYSKGKNGAIIFEFTNYENVNLAYCIAEATVAGTDEKNCCIWIYFSRNLYDLIIRQHINNLQFK